MFRSKTKKIGGRKRREIEIESDNIDATVSSDVFATSSTEIPVSNACQTAENDLHVLEQLRRNRSRAAKSAMTFSSKRSSIRSSESNDSDVIATGLQLEETGLLLSFEDEEKKTKKRKMRPNFVASNAVDVDLEVTSSGRYSSEKLAALRSEQSVLLSSKTEMMEVEEGNDEEVKEMVEEEEEEEFIALDGEEKKTMGRRTKNRVTFGVHSEGVDMSKKVEVVEEIRSDGEDEEEEQSRRWEEELMRRGGHRAPQPLEMKGSLKGDGLPTYPTRRKVTCVSLGSVLGKLEKGVELTSLEDQRASHELARLEAETVLMETALKQQEEELLISSEEFEFFQEVEDFVKGLSFCLRAKVPVITAMEEKIVSDRARRVKDKQQEEQHGIAQEVQYYLSSGTLQPADIVGLNQLSLQSSGDDTAASSVHDSDHTCRKQKYQQHFTESYVADPHIAEEDLFADAIDEINSLERVYGRFQEWKAKFPQVYKDVYCELAQEKLFAPYVQAEMLHWDPLAVADAQTGLGKSWSLDDFAWFRVLHQHLAQSENGSRKGDNVDGPILYQIRDVLGKVRAATVSYFDPYSSLQTRSLSLVLEEVTRHGYCAHVEEAVQILVSTALEAFSSEAKRTVLVAIDQNAVTSDEDVNLFARYLLERFNALQDNLLTLFVALPKGTIAASGFRCLLQVLHHLLAYVRQCQETNKTQLVGTATQIVRQLSGSSYLVQLLSEPSQERELMHILQLFKPFLQTTAH